MKTILDIQKDIRNLENSMEDFQRKIQNISSDLEALRDSGDTGDFDFDKIKTVSQYNMFKDHPLANMTDLYSRKLYLMILINVMRLDKDGYEEKLIFIHWILTKSNLGLEIEDLLKDSYLLHSSEFDKLSEYIAEDYRLYLVLDALITANINGPSNEESYSYIANICAVFGMDTEQVRVLTKLAQIVLEQTAVPVDIAGEADVVKYNGKFKHYLPKEFIKRDRVLTVNRYCRYTDFKWKVKQGSFVNKEQVIAVYGGKDLKAPREGILFQFKEGDFNYGVISNIFDNKDSIKAWAKQRR